MDFQTIGWWIVDHFREEIRHDGRSQHRPNPDPQLTGHAVFPLLNGGLRLLGVA